MIFYGCHPVFFFFFFVFCRVASHLFILMTLGGILIFMYFSYQFCLPKCHRWFCHVNTHLLHTSVDESSDESLSCHSFSPRPRLQFEEHLKPFTKDSRFVQWFANSQAEVHMYIAIEDSMLFSPQKSDDAIFQATPTLREKKLGL